MQEQKLESAGLIVWANPKEMPGYVRDVIKISSKVFDKLYVITNYKRVRDNYNVKYLNLASVLTRILSESGFHDLNYRDITSYVAYNSVNLLNRVYHIKVNSVFTFDADFIPYNKYLINSISQDIAHKPFVATEKCYTYNYNQILYSSCLTFFNVTEESNSLSELLIREWNKSIQESYEGDNMLTDSVLLENVSEKFLVDLEWNHNLRVSGTSVDTLNPVMPKIIEMQPDKLGIHLNMSIYNKNKLTGSNNIRVKINKNNYIELNY